MTTASRRRLLEHGVMLGLLPWSAVHRIASAAPTPNGAGWRLAAAWQDDGQDRVGLLALGPGEPLRVLWALDVPTRAHGVWMDAQGRLVAVARRPGDWLLRWRGPGHEPEWHWIEPGRAFNGHVVASPDGRTLCATETDLDAGLGCIGVRDAASLEKVAEWPTSGRDPHQLLWDRAGRLVVANGGIETRPETGRIKHGLAQMDSSLVRLQPRDAGRIEGQWRVDDRRLSLRHLAWRPDGAELGIAIQAEHDDPAQRAAAPVLAVFDGRALRVVESPRALGGYGGDIAALPGGYVVSCPRVDGLAHYVPGGTAAQPGAPVAWADFTPLDQAYALASAPGRWLVGGLPRAASLRDTPSGAPRPDAPAPTTLRIDNHWALTSRG